MNATSPSVLTTEQGVRFHPRFQARALDSGEVVLLSEQDTHVLSGPEYSALEPLLDGSRNPDALVECLADYFPRERIYYALMRLQTRGLLDFAGQPVTNSEDLNKDSVTLPEKLTTPPHIHVYKMVIRQPLSSRLGSGVVLRPITVSGWGTSDEEARARCLGEAEERRSMFSAPKSKLRRARISDLEGRAIPLEELDLPSLSQRTNQKDLELRGGESPVKPQSCDSEIEIDWIEAWSWSRQQPIWLPAAYCFFAHAQVSPTFYYRADSNGCAAGGCLTDAVCRGLFELIERDACTQWEFNKLGRPTIDVTALPDPFLSASIKAIKDAGRTMKIFDLTHDLGIPVTAAVSWRMADGTGFRLGLGARANYYSAIRQSVGELNQLIFGNNEDSADIPVPEYIRTPKTNSAEAPRRITNCNRTEVSPSVLENYLKKVNQRGLELLVLDQTETQNTLHVVRVVVPGLGNLPKYFAPMHE